MRRVASAEVLMLLTLALMAAQIPASAAVPTSVDAAAAAALPGRESDARVAAIAARLASAGLARCPEPAGDAGFVLQHLSDFEAGDRARLGAALGLDRGPAVIALMPGGAAERAGVALGDVLLAIDGERLPPEASPTGPFSAEAARARADMVHDLLSGRGPRPVALLVRRGGEPLRLRLELAPACPVQVRLARSAQRNAFADARHVYMTTGLLALMRSDDELAFVLAHEMAHIILGHAAAMRSGAVRGGLGRTLGRSGRIVRGAERQADLLAAEMMIEAGYDAVSGAAVLRRLGGLNLGIAILADHDPAGSRIAAVRAFVEGRR